MIDWVPPAGMVFSFTQPSGCKITYGCLLGGAIHVRCRLCLGTFKRGLQEPKYTMRYSPNHSSPVDDAFGLVTAAI